MPDDLLVQQGEPNGVLKSGRGRAGEKLGIFLRTKIERILDCDFKHYGPNRLGAVYRRCLAFRVKVNRMEC